MRYYIIIEIHNLGVYVITCTMFPGKCLLKPGYSVWLSFLEIYQNINNRYLWVLHNIYCFRNLFYAFQFV